MYNANLLNAKLATWATVLQSYQIIIYGFSVGLAILWQRHLMLQRDRHYNRPIISRLPEFVASFVPDRIPNRAVVPYLCGFFIIVGTLVYSLFMMIDGQYDGADVARNLFKTGIFLVIITTKAWFGPVVLSLSVAYAFWLLVNGQTLAWFPALHTLLHWAFQDLPANTVVLYSFSTLLYLLGASLYDTWHH